MFHYSTKHPTLLYKVVAIVLLTSFLYSPLFSTFGHAEETTPEESKEVVVIEEPEPLVPEEIPETIIETGEAEAVLDTENSVNTNVTELEEVIETASSSVLTTELIPLLEQQPDSVEVVNDNQATTTLDAEVEADTGNNTASGDTVTIDTGDAIAYANVLNVVNTNIVNSDGLVTFINDVLGYQDFDLRDTFEDIYTTPETANSTPACTLTECQTGNIDLNVENTNTANIDNNITVVADTGSNNATGTDVSITTGDAYASANVINAVNTNITDSNYLLLVFNNYDDYSGDLILPSQSFFNDVFQSGVTYNNANITNNNTAAVTNTVNTSADTGSNTASGDTATISTGNAGAQTDVTNVVNTNLFGGNSFSMLIKVHGDWNGEIFGLPDGMTWARTEQGVQLLYDASGGTTRTGTINNLSVTNTNQATVNNNVNVFALTGNNAASGENASIQTGDAYARTNVLNLVNTNIVGQNWANLIFNMYGNWDGNISFGVPDLWIGAKATSSDDPVMPGSEVTYTFTITNFGDTDAPNVVLTNDADTGHLTFTDATRLTTTNTLNRASWDVGTIPAGETREVTVHTQTNKYLPRTPVTNIPLLAAVTSDTPDANDVDNEEYIEIEVGSPQGERSEFKRTFSAHYNIKKTANRNLANPGDTVDYSVNFFSRGGPLYEAMLVDILTNEAGDVIQEQSWPLGTIETWEDITINYSVNFSPETATGTYTNTAQLLGFHESRRKKYQTLYESDLVSHALEIVDGPTGQVLGIAASCEQYIHTFMRNGVENNTAEVIRLQTFLNAYEDASIPISGIFDIQTEIAVRDFQSKYADEVLIPWGLTGDSGFVYLTTRKKINELYCDNTRLFPMTDGEQSEINRYRTRLGLPERTPKETPLADTTISLLEETTIKPTQRHTQTVTPPPESSQETEQPEATQDSFMDSLRTRIGRWLRW